MENNSVGADSSSTDNSQQSSTALLGDTPRKALSTLREEFRQSSINSHKNNNTSLESFVQNYKSSPSRAKRRLTRWRRLSSNDLDSTMPEEEDEEEENKKRLLGDNHDDDDDDDDDDVDDE